MKWYADAVEAYTGEVHRHWFATFEEACNWASRIKGRLPDGNDRVAKINMLGRMAKDVIFVNGERK